MTTSVGIGKLQSEADIEAFIRSRLQPIEQLVRQLQGFSSSAGNGSPEGVVESQGASIYRRLDAPDADHAVYFNPGSGVTTGWKRLISTGYAAA